jgi:DNA-binding transcriptional LysR family regulator
MGATISKGARDPDLDLNLVAVFIRVVSAGSFTAAAAGLGVPKSTVSRAVSRLEDALGVRLLQRTTRRLGLTEAGQSYLAEVRGPLTRLQEASAEVSALTAEPRGVVRLSIAPGMADGPVAELLVEFVHAHPRVRIELVVTSRQVNLVAEGIDLALRAGRLDDSTLVARKVATTELALYAAPGYLARRGLPHRISDLTEHDCILYRARTGPLPWRLMGPRGPVQPAVSGSINTDDLGSIRMLILAGLGIGLMPTLGAQAEIAQGKVVRVLPAYAQAGAALYVVSPPLRLVPSRVTLLRDHLVRELGARLASAFRAA